MIFLFECLCRFEDISLFRTKLIYSIPRITLGFLLCACSPSVEVTIPTESSTPTAEEVHVDASPEPNLDLHEANVLDVSFQKLEGNAYLFVVTLIHDDDGEAPNFADSWQVEDLSGVVLGTRVLLHSHGNQPFSRSETIEVPAGAAIVVVRGHDMVHGHGGQSMRVNLETGDVEPFIEEGD
jgi:hypothetical protein